MDINIPIELEGVRLARASAASALCALALLASPHVSAQSLTPAQAVLLHTRITGVPPSATILSQMTTGTPAAAAALATSQPQFYNVTLRNIFAAESNRDGSVFVPLNDYIVTAIGMVHDDVPYNTALSADILYT